MDSLPLTSGRIPPVAFTTKFECKSLSSDDVFHSNFRIKIDDHFVEQRTLGIYSAIEAASQGLVILFQPIGIAIDSPQDSGSLDFQTSLNNVCAITQSNEIAWPFTTTVFEGYKFSSDLIGSITQLQRQCKIDDALDLIYQTIDDKLLNDELTEVDFFLRQINTSFFTEDILIGILTITLPWNRMLTNRQIFFEKVQSRLSLAKGMERASKVLEGLE